MTRRWPELAADQTRAIGLPVFRGNPVDRARYAAALGFLGKHLKTQVGADLPHLFERPIPVLDDDDEARAARYQFERGNRGPWWDMLRARGPVVLYEGEYLLTRRADVVAALRNPAFHTLPFTTFDEFGVAMLPLGFEGAAHERYREILAPAFAPRNVARIEPAQRTQAAILIEGVDAKGGCDLMPLAEIFACRALHIMVGLPLAADRLLAVLSSPPGVLGRRLFAYVHAAVSAAVKSPRRRGLLAHLLAGGDDRCGPPGGPIRPTFGLIWAGGPAQYYGEIDGRLYLDMRLIERRDLQTVLADGPMEPRRALIGNSR